MRRLGLLVILMICGLATSLSAAELTTKPRLAVLASKARFPAEDQRLVEVLEARLVPLQRFEVMPTATASSALDFSGTESPARAIAQASSASALVLVGFRDDPTATFVRDTDLEGRYVCQSEVDYLLMQVSNGQVLERKVLLYRGESPSSREVAESYAYDHVADDLVRSLQETFRLGTRIVARTGRTVTLADGSEQGLQVGMFLVPEASGSSGRIEVSRVASDSAQGTIIAGYYDWKVGDRLVEQAYASLPAAIGLTRTQLLGPKDGFFSGMSVDYNRSGIGWGASLELGQLYQDSVGGFGLYPRLVAQREWIPERLWGYLEGGAGVAFLTEGIPGTPDDATSYSLHGLIGAGLSGELVAGLGISLGLTYLTPWVADRWTQSTGTFNAGDVSTQVHHPQLGGLGVHASLVWTF